MSTRAHPEKARFPSPAAAPGSAIYWPDWRAVCTSVTGSGHLAEHRECQDAFRCNYDQLTDPRVLSEDAPAGAFIASISDEPSSRSHTVPGALIASISDGLSSKRHSALGSALAVTIAQAAAQDVFGSFPWSTADPQDLKAAMLEVVEAALSQVSDSVSAVTKIMRRQGQDREFNATLLIVVFRPPWLLAANVGDGFVIAQRGKGHLLMVARPYGSESDPSATTTMLSSSATDLADIKILYDPELTGFAASTDGLAQVSLDWADKVPTNPHEDFFTPLLAGLASGSLGNQEVAGFLSQPKTGEAAPDDLTLVAVARTPAEGRR